MAETIKVTFHINQAHFGLAEAYWNTGASFGVLADRVNDLIQARNAMLFENAYIAEVIISRATPGPILPETAKITRESQLFIPGTYRWTLAAKDIVIPPRGFRVLGAVPLGSPEQFRSVLQYQATLKNGLTVIRYLSGIPDDIIGTEPNTLHLENDPVFKAAMEAFFGMLKEGGANWQVKSAIRGAPYTKYDAIELVTQNTTGGRLGVQVPASPNPTIPSYGLVHLTGFRRRSRGGISLNGRFYVQSRLAETGSDRVTYFLRGTEGQNPADWKVMGKIQQYVLDYIGIAECRAIRGGVHKRGAPFPRIRGRRLTRTSLDP